MIDASALAEPLPCDYCGQPTVLMTGVELYSRGPGAVKDKHFYVCRPCNAWIGCHPGTIKPIGRLANAELRRAKQDAHAAFDPIWRRKAKRDGIKAKDARGAGYAWLAAQLGIDPKDCHIGAMDVAMCRRVVVVCSPYLGENRRQSA